MSLADGGKAMRHNYNGTAMHQPVHTVEEVSLGFQVECSRWFIEEENGRILEVRTSQCDALLLTDRQFRAPVPHVRCVLFGERVDKLVRPCGFRSSD